MLFIILLLVWSMNVNTVVIWWKNVSTQNLWWLKEIKNILRTLLNVGFEIWDNDYIDGDVKVRDHCHITRKYRGSAHRDCNINVKLNHKIRVTFHNLKKCDSHLIM